jgi:hypothetical protein
MAFLLILCILVGLTWSGVSGFTCTPTDRAICNDRGYCNNEGDNCVITATTGPLNNVRLHTMAENSLTQAIGAILTKWTTTAVGWEHVPAMECLVIAWSSLIATLGTDA